MSRVSRYLVILVLYGILAIAVLELMYRYQLVDTYQPELKGFNDPSDLEEVSDRPTILVMGDSFTAGSSHYANRMNRLLPSHRVINSGVGGTGIIQASFMAPRRFDRFDPIYSSTRSTSAMICWISRTRSIGWSFLPFVIFTGLSPRICAR